MKQARRSWLSKVVLAFIGLSFTKTRDFATLHGEKGSLGAFSISLNVKDIEVSKQFYGSLGFEVFSGSSKENFLILKNGNAVIGLFHGMFEKTIMTFNPGWNEEAEKLEKFDDIRVIQKRLKQEGIKLATEADEKTSGPASFTVIDPDGNPILFDQHV